jgi:hypothetical protein
MDIDFMTVLAILVLDCRTELSCFTTFSISSLDYSPTAAPFRRVSIQWTPASLPQSMVCLQFICGLMTGKPIEMG